MRTGEEAATIEAIFESGGEELLVRREITAQGRSRAFINGALATAGALKDLSARLIELHGQHEHQTLLDPSTHLAVLDRSARWRRNLAATTDAAFDRLRAATEELGRARRLRGRPRCPPGTRRVSAGGARSGRAASRAKTTNWRRSRQVLASAERVERLCAESYASLV